MLRKCAICSKGAMSGRTLVRKGLEKKKGGTGSKISRRNLRKFKANLQKMRILVNGHPKQVYLCSRCIKKSDFLKA